MAEGFVWVSLQGGGIEPLLAGGNIALSGFTGGANLSCASAFEFGSGGSICANLLLPAECAMALAHAPKCLIVAAKPSWSTSY